MATVRRDNFQGTQRFANKPQNTSCVACINGQTTSLNQQQTTKLINKQARVNSSLYMMNLKSLTYQKKPDQFIPPGSMQSGVKTTSGRNVAGFSQLRNRTIVKESPGNSKHGSYDRYLMKKKKRSFVTANGVNNGIINVGNSNDCECDRLN